MAKAEALRIPVILVVEDEALVRTLAVDIFEDAVRGG